MLRLALHWQILIGMIVGAAIGLSLNLTVSDRHQIVSEGDLPRGIAYLEFHDTTNRIDITIEPVDGERRHHIVDGTRSVKGAVATLKKLNDSSDEETYDKQAYELFQQRGRSTARRIGDAAQRLGRLFLRMLQMVAVPLIVTSLTTGVLGLGHAERLGAEEAAALGA